MRRASSASRRSRAPRRTVSSGNGRTANSGEGADMSDKDKGLPLLQKTPVDFLSRDEARQALNPDAALDATEAAKALRAEPNSENILLAQHLSHASHGSHGSHGSH